MKIDRGEQIFVFVVVTIIGAGLYWGLKYISKIWSFSAFMTLCVTGLVCIGALAWWLDKRMAKAKGQRSDEP